MVIITIIIIVAIIIETFAEFNKIKELYFTKNLSCKLKFYHL